MPTYTYRCTACGYTFDKRQAFTESALTECPRCGAALRKVFGDIGVTFKGSGFYHTDAGSGSKGAGATHGGGEHHHAHADSTAAGTSEPAAKPAAAETTASTANPSKAPAAPAA